MQNKNINFTKYKLFPIWNYTVESNIDNYKIEISKNDDEINIYKYGELKNKVFFMFIKYLPVMILFLMITSYELEQSLTEVFLGFCVASVGLLVNMKYDDSTSFIVACFWFLLFSFIIDIQNSSMIAKYALLSYFIYQFIFDLYRKYYEVYDNNNNLLSYAFIKRKKY